MNSWLYSRRLSGVRGICFLAENGSWCSVLRRLMKSVAVLLPPAGPAEVTASAS